MELSVSWDATMMLEVLLKHPDDFLKVRETLTRIGVSSREGNKLYQSCHILHKQGRYFIVSFKELFMLEGREANFSLNDVQRRNRIAYLLDHWGLVKLVEEIKSEDMVPMSQIKVISYKDKEEWELITKFDMGNRRGSGRYPHK